MKISIVTTTYNRKELLQDTITSVQNTILTPLKDVSFEHIIYDDGSSDGTHTLFPNTAWKNVVYYRSEHNEGVAAAKSAAVAQATGEYVFILDSDDIIIGRAVYNFALEAIEHSTTSWFVSDFLRVDHNLRYLIGEDYYGWKFENPNELLDAVLKGEHFMQGNVLFKKELFEAVGGFDRTLTMAEDLDLYTRFLSAGHMPKYVPFISHLHRFHCTNLSVGETLAKHKERMSTWVKK